MSDTESKKPSKGADHVSGKKRSSATAVAAIAAAAASAATVEDVDENRKRAKHDRKQQSIMKDEAKQPTIPATINKQEEEEEEEEDEEDAEVADLADPAIVADVALPVAVKQEALPVVEKQEALPMAVKQEALPVAVKQEALPVAVKQEDGGKIMKICPSVRKLAANVVLASRGPPDAVTIVPKPETFVLVMVTNDVEWVSKMNKERESAFTSVSFVTIKVLEAGYNSAPYEKAEGANAKQLVYCDKKGKPLNGKPTKLASISMVDNVKHLDMKTWEPHPSAMMKNKWRGTPTDCVGVISPGIPFSCLIFNENKDSVMDNETTELNLKPFSLAIVGLVVKSREQCVAGYGVSIKSIKHVEGVNVTMMGLYHDKFFYNDSRPIVDQTDERLALKTRVKEYDSDLSFVTKLVRNTGKSQVTEKPIVCIMPFDSTGNAEKTNKHCVHMQPNNKCLELEMVDKDSIYHEKRFRINIPHNMFTIDETGLPWIQFYFQWLLDSNACRIMIVHDDYQFNRMAEGTGSASMHCALIPDEERLLSEKSEPLELSASIMAVLGDRIQGRKNTVDMYTGWVIRNDITNKKKYAVLFDTTKAYGPETVKREAADDDDVASAVVDDGGMNECDPADEHTSIVCRIYKGMNPARHIWRAYLLTIDTENDAVDRLFQIGIKSKPAYVKPAGCSVSADSNIFESCDMLFD